MESSKQNTRAAEDAETAHLEGIEGGCGCVEVWENLSSQRNADD